MSAWPMVPLGAVADFTTGSTPPTSVSDNFGGEVPWANISDLGPRTIHGTNKSLSRRGIEAGGFPAMTQPGDLMFSFKLSVGETSFAGVPMHTNEAIATFRAGQPLDLRFAYYVLPKFLLLAAQTNIYGAPLLNGSLMRRARIPFPPTSTQRRIADYLDRETGEIDAMLAKLDEMESRLTDRSSAVLRATSDSAAGPSGLERNLSPASGAPDEWRISKFGYELIESGERNSDHAEPPGPLLSISEYRGVELNSRTDGQQPSLDVSNYRVVRPDQLAANMMWLNHGGLGVSKTVGYVSPDYKAFEISPRLLPAYVHHLLRSARYVSYFEAVGTGVRPNAKRVTKTAWDMTPIPIPPLDEQRRIADQLDEVTRRTNAMLEKVAKLKALLIERRAALITEVVTGRKEV